MKMIDLEKHPDARQTVQKEATIQRMLSHPNIIQYYGKRSEPTMEYIFLEYAAGGELFDRIGKLLYCCSIKPLSNVLLIVNSWKQSLTLVCQHGKHKSILDN